MRYTVSSSDGSGTYTVTVAGDVGTVRMKCTCAAGENGTYCKHRINLIDGDYRAVLAGDVSALAVLKEWLPGSTLEAALAEKRAADKALDDAKKRVKQATLSVSKALLTG